ncbi:hypothetical protein DH2020_045544 [Rehmannia glutinosa]|uniref:HTH myb-type domain-containing protein n=1 Tax=Rehmannia glutinosa TaxID=99300 RepID=A0ABR0UDV1_REHGL
MLAVSPLRNERENQIQSFSMEENNEFPEFTTGNLLDAIDFDDFCVGISNGDVLPDLEMESEIMAEFSVTAGEEPEMNRENDSGKNEKAATVSISALDLGSGEETVSKREKPIAVNKIADKGRKSSKNPPGKKKVKVDWTPELHRRFVEAVEKLGVEKAVPSRILELMGIDCLTRHNIASHLQKYRSHRKHLLAREAEAASWNQRRQVYGTPAKREVNPWIAPTVGFPPMPPFRPLHVWGHPSVDQSLTRTWPAYVAPPPPAWPHHLPPLPPADPSFWHSHGSYRFPTAPVCGIPTPVPGLCVVAGQTMPRPPSDVHPSKESIDAAIGDVLRKPWLPLPIGLKPPSVDTVMVELKHHGISKVPPTCD